MSMRAYSSRTQKILFAESDNRCAFPNCATAVVSRVGDDDEAVITGEICHILPASTDGPRAVSEELRRGINEAENLIILCPTHHKIIDDQPTTYTLEVLRSWKASRRAAAAQPQAQDIVEISRLPATQADVLGRDNQIASLHAAWRGAGTRVASIVALGGFGKSALVNRWLAELSEQGYAGARIFGWSFYAQGVTTDFATSGEFMQAALGWFGDTDPLAGDEQDKGRRLASLIRSQPTVLILDGLEPLQRPPGPGGGELADSAMKALLSSLAAINPGLCVITTRYQVTDLERFGKGVLELKIGGLTVDAGAALLRSLGVKGSDAALEDAVTEYDGHPLALRLLGSFIVIAHGGKIEMRSEIPLREWDNKQGGKARRIMESYKSRLADRPALQILRMLGLFDRPADAASLSALRNDPPIVGLTDRIDSNLTWASEIYNLREAGLIANETPERAGELDTHPLIREFFGSDLLSNTPKAWADGHSRIFDHVRASTARKPDNLVGMFPLFVAISHGSKAGRYKEALRNIYIDRIQRGRSTYYSTKKFGIPSQHLAALRTFFVGDRITPTLDVADRIYVLMELAYELRALGQLHDTIPILVEACKQSLNATRFRDCAAATDNLTEIYLYIGDMSKALSFARQTVKYAIRSGRDFELMYAHCALANAQHLSGDFTGAARNFALAESYQARRQPDDPRLKSLNGTQYCDLLISTGAIGEAIDRAEEIWQGLSQTDNNEIALAIASVVLARALLLSPDPPVNRARSLIESSIEILRNTGQRQELAIALISLATLAGNEALVPSDHVQAAVLEAKEIASAARSPILLAEVSEALAKVRRLSGDEMLAVEHAAVSARLRKEAGYCRPPICRPDR